MLVISYQHFLLFSQSFKKVVSLQLLNLPLCGNGLTHFLLAHIYLQYTNENIVRNEMQILAKAPHADANPRLFTKCYCFCMMTTTTPRLQQYLGFSKKVAELKVQNFFLFFPQCFNVGFSALKFHIFQIYSIQFYIN